MSDEPLPVFPWSVELQQAIRQLVHLAAQEPGELGRYAQAWQALPGFRGWEEDYLIRPDGAVLKVSGIHPPAKLIWDSHQTALWVGYAAQRYPTLRSLLPTRPEDQPLCHLCSGRRELKPHFVCPACAGLGWRFQFKLA